MSERNDDQPPQMMPIMPRPAWMWKPRSKKVVEDSFGGVAASFFGVRNFGAQQWKRRYVSVEGKAICYGKSAGKREKVIPLDSIRAVNYSTRDVLLAAHAPRSKADFGWFMYMNDKEMMFCCDNDAVRDEWVSFILAVLRLTSGLEKSLSLSPQEGGGTQTTSSLVAGVSGRIQSLEREWSPSSLTGTQSCINVLDTDRGVCISPQRVQASLNPEFRFSLCSENANINNSSHRHPNDDAEDSDTVMSASSCNVDDTLDEGNNLSLSSRVSSVLNLVQVNELREDGMHARGLLPKAQQRCLHIEHKLQSLKDHFRPGDNIHDVVFCRSVEKIGSRDAIQERDLVLTHQYLYLFAPRRMTGGEYARCIGTQQIVGVIESTTEKNLVAILIPSFHDILIRFNKQNSVVEGDEIDVKLQLIAHLYKIYLENHKGQRFVFREVENVRTVIRRSVKEQHLPLMSLPEDRMLVGTSKGLLSLFRAYAESVVYWSSMVTCVKKDRQLQLRALVITDGAIYIISDTLVKVSQRIPLLDMVSLMFDRDSQTILIHCRELDTLFTVQSSIEFARIIALIPEVLLHCCDVTISATPSKHLYERLQRADILKVKDPCRDQATDSIVRKHMKFSQRILASIHPSGLRSYFNGSQFDGGKPLLTEAQGRGNGVHIKCPGTAAFLAQYRFVEELIVEFEDEKKLLASAPSIGDFLALNGRFSTDFDIGRIYYSSLCSILDVKILSGGTILNERTLDKCRVRRVLSISSEGILLLNHSEELAKLRRAFKPSLLCKNTSGGIARHKDSTNTQDPRVALFLVWSEVVGLIRCYPGQGTVVALMTGPGHSSDYMLDVESEHNVNSFLSLTAWRYVQYHHHTPYSYEMLPLFTVPRVENVRNALKKTVLDPKPTIALRRVPVYHASDDLHVAVVPDIAEACRRFGDNAIYFSGVAWRYRISVTKKKLKKISTATINTNRNDKTMNERGLPKSETHKAFIIILTNCAIYWCTHGGFEIVRRTELRDMKEVYLSHAEPDSILITVPKEYDMYFYIIGRGKEFLARLQEAYVAWTDYDLYLPHETYGGPHVFAKYALPERVVTHLASVGNLDKPPHVDEIGANRSAKEVKSKMESFHCSCLSVAIANHESAVKAAFKGQLPREKSECPSGTEKVTWERVCKSLLLSWTILEFVHQRAYRFSLRSTTFKEMERAQLLLWQFDMMTTIVERLQHAIKSENLAIYEAVLAEAKQYDWLWLLLEESREVYENLKQRRYIVESITNFLSSNTRGPLKDSEAKLELFFEKAMKSDVREEVLQALRRRVDTCAQQEQMLAQLQIHQRAVVAGEEEPPSEGVLLLLIEAARQLRISVSVVETTLVRGSFVVVSHDNEQPQLQFQQENVKNVDDVTCDAIHAAALMGDVVLLKQTLRLAEVSPSEILKKKIQWGWDQLTIHREHHGGRRAAQRLIERIAVHRKCRDWSAAKVSKLWVSCNEVLQLLPCDAPVMGQIQRVVKLQMHTLEGEKYRLELRDSIWRQVKEAHYRYKEGLREEEKREEFLLQERERKEAEACRRRRAEFLFACQGRGRMLVGTMEETIQSDSELCVKQCLRQCMLFQKEIQDGLDRFKGMLAEWDERERQEKKNEEEQEEENEMKEIVEKIFSQLRTATMRGEDYLKACERNTDLYALSALEAENTEVVVPHELMAIIRANNSRALIEYVQSHQIELTTNVITRVRDLWNASRQRQQWTYRLHRAIHTAFVLKRVELLQAQIDAAKTAGHMDEVVESAIEVVAAMQAQQKSTALRKPSEKDRENEDQKKNGESSNNSMASMSSDELTTSYPSNEVPLILTISRAYDAESTDTVERLMGQLHAATLAILESSKRRVAESKVMLPKESGKIMSNVVELWCEVFHHRLRPSGNVFHGVKRDCFDLLRFVGQYNVSGDYLAPYTNRLLSDFERIKKYNVPQGKSGGHILITYMLQQELLERVVYEIEQLGPKARGNVLFEDALLNHGLCDLLLLARMVEQMDWSPLVLEYSDVSVITAREGSTAYPLLCPTDGEGNHRDEKQNRVTIQEEKVSCVPRVVEVEKCMTLVRSAVNILSNYFAQQFATLGQCPSAESARELFNEGRHKGIGLVVQEHVIPVLVSILSMGFRSKYHLVRTRHVWDAVLEFGECLRHSVRDLSGVSILNVLQLVDATTDVNGRNRSRLHSFSEKEIADIQLHVFLIACLNLNVLAAFLQTFFQSEEGTTRWASKDGLWKFYERDRCLRYPSSEERMKELMDLISLLSELPFVLIVDRELW